MPVLEIDADLPGAALADGPEHLLADLVAAADGIWLQGRADRFDLDAGGAVTAWHPRVGAAPATPTQPNTGNARLTIEDGIAGFQTTTGQHCGLMMPGVAPHLRIFSLAVIYRPDPVEEPRTLLTLNTNSGGKSGGYFFVSDSGTELVAKDTNEALSMTLPAEAAPRDPRLLLITVSGNRIAVQRDGGFVYQATGKSPGLSGAPDLFIASRSHRAGLQKTLGQSTFLDVFFWPGWQLLMPTTPADEAQRTALTRYYNWVYGP